MVDERNLEVKVYYDRGKNPLVKVVHLPTSTKVKCDRHKSEYRNRKEAIAMLDRIITSGEMAESG